MKRIIAILSLLAALSFSLRAQELFPAADTLPPAQVDSTLLGIDPLSLMGPSITVNQSPAMKRALSLYIINNSARTLQGYRIRVYFGNDQAARVRSESIAAYIRSSFPEVAVYRTYEKPNFKVVVGDFRTRDEALGLYTRLKQIYPTAFIIKETINYPR